MSHIPSSAMPHAHANGDTVDDQPPRSAGGASPPEPTTATPDLKGEPSGDATAGAPLAASATRRAEDAPPLASAAPATTTGERKGSDAATTIRASGELDGTQADSGQPAVGEDTDATDHATGSTLAGGKTPGGRPAWLNAVIAIGGLAAVGGVVAALFPVLRPKPEPKSKKRKRKKD